MEHVEKLVAARGTPVLVAIAGPTAAGKTEIVERLRSSWRKMGRRATLIEMHNFLTDRDRREQEGIFTLGEEAIHVRLFERSVERIRQGRKVAIPRYDFVHGSSSHDPDGSLRPGCAPLEIEPGEVVLIEGNFPFLIRRVADLIGIKVVYLTDDAIRLQRRWKRDIDYRKKYEPRTFAAGSFGSSF